MSPLAYAPVPAFSTSLPLDMPATPHSLETK